MKNVKAPQFLSDLYRDLRDRRLLLPAIALAVALVAIPMVLKGTGSEAVPPPPAAPVAVEDAAAVQSAVLAEQVGIRNYRKRLAALKEKNPFTQRFAPPAANELAGDIASTDTTATLPTDTSTASSSSSSTSSTSTSTGTDTAPILDDGASGPEPQPEVVTEEPKIRFYTSRVDVTTGPVGDLKKVDGVRGLDLLPNDRKPLVSFLGISETGDTAVFLVSADVTATDGDGSCAPKSPAPCQFLTLKEGETRYLDYGPDRTRYRLTVRKIRVVRVPKPNGLDGSKKPKVSEKLRPAPAG